MADNVGYTPGSGATVAADDIDGVLYQRVKLAIGADGEATDASSLNPLPVADDGVRDLLAPMIALLESPRGYDKSLQRQRGTVVVESGTVTTVTTVTTCSTVTNLSQIDNIQGRIGQLGENLSAWSACVRARIS